MVTLAVVFCDMSSHRFIISSATSRGDLLRRSFVPTCSMISPQAAQSRKVNNYKDLYESR